MLAQYAPFSVGAIPVGRWTLVLIGAPRAVTENMDAVHERNSSHRGCHTDLRPVRDTGRPPNQLQKVRSLIIWGTDRSS